jgi:hypothetical protein
MSVTISHVCRVSALCVAMAPTLALPLSLLPLSARGRLLYRADAASSDWRECRKVEVVGKPVISIEEIRKSSGGYVA